MGSVKLGDETISDRRRNGSRLKLDTGDWIKIVSVVIVVILGFGNIQWTVNNHSGLLAEQSNTIKTNTGLIRDTCKDVEFLKKTMDKIELQYSQIDSKLTKLLNGNGTH